MTSKDNWINNIKNIFSLTFVVIMIVVLQLAITSAAIISDYVVDPYHEYSYEEMLADANKLQEKYPEFIRLKSIGNSVEGRDLALIEFGNGARKIFLNGSTHAREYITTTYLMYMVDRYAYAYTNGGMYDGFDLSKLLNSVTFCILPMVNPDGVNLVQNGINSVQNPKAVAKIKINNADSQGYSSWKANINGVDLNRNYPDIWTVKSPVQVPSSSNFKGFTPLSEPETKAIISFMNNNMCWANISFHTQGEVIYGWNDANIRFYPQLGGMVSRIIKDSGFKRITDSSGTKYGNFANYARATYLKPTLTIELCKSVGPYPYPNTYFSKVWAPAKNICLIVAEEVMKMQEQDYRVYQNDRFLHAFSAKQYALDFARKWSNAKVLFVKDVKNTITTIAPITLSIAMKEKSTTVQAYSLDDINYIKLRDLAISLTGTDKQFEAHYDYSNKAIMLTSGAAYTVVEGELAREGSTVSESLRDTVIATYLNDTKIDIKAYNIGGSNYFDLQALSAALNLGMTYDSVTKIINFDDETVSDETIKDENY